MKKAFLVLVCLVTIISCEYKTPSNATPEYFSEEEQCSSICGECGGRGVIYTYYGPVQCYVCGGNGVNVSFKSRQAYYAECAHEDCKCTLFQKESKGSTKCKCGHLQSTHVKRYN